MFKVFPHKQTAFSKVPAKVGNTCSKIIPLWEFVFLWRSVARKATTFCYTSLILAWLVKTETKYRYQRSVHNEGIVWSFVRAFWTLPVHSSCMLTENQESKDFQNRLFSLTRASCRSRLPENSSTQGNDTELSPKSQPSTQASNQIASFMCFVEIVPGSSAICGVCRTVWIGPEHVHLRFSSSGKTEQPHTDWGQKSVGRAHV